MIDVGEASAKPCEQRVLDNDVDVMTATAHSPPWPLVPCWCFVEAKGGFDPAWDPNKGHS